MNLDPKSTALIAIHCQGDIMGAEGAFADFFHPEVVNRNIVEKLSGLLASARDAGTTVVYTQIAYAPDYSDLHANSPLLQIAQQRNSLKHGGAQTHFLEALTPQQTDLVVVNQRVGGFTTDSMWQSRKTHVPRQRPKHTTQAFNPLAYWLRSQPQPN